jgi:hypothetical protein
MAEIVFRDEIVRKQLYAKGRNHSGVDAMSFKISSQSFRDGDYLSEAHILSKISASVAREAISLRI